ncbi:hypothetical protein HPC49_17365 [Pyxidicoccus fallax]|uniref:Uncharacterized protein n=2 Tax=Pyxidicoccus fallax TaxID=394095 RepID=A0A848LKJ5_9BACT|nr:hypothetical protein [Pyxidicoccus fallax]NPC79982.1 hypothetical protein [Pyxidicoccus fallax]
MCVLLSACGGNGLPPVGEGGSESIRMEISLAGDVCGVVTAQATVQADDIGVIGPVPLDVTGTSIQGRINSVPAGVSRTVSVFAFNALGLEVYAGSVKVDVAAGQVTAARLALRRNTTNCPGSTTGAIDIIGVLESGEPQPDAGTDAGTDPDGGIVLGGADFNFSFQEATLADNGVIHFMDTDSDRIRRLDLEARAFLPALVGTGDVTAMAVSPDGTASYVAYTGGRIDIFDSQAGGSGRFFAAAPAYVSEMVVAGNYLFTVDGSGAWSTQALYQRSTGARVHAVDWRFSAGNLTFSPLDNSVYYVDVGVSPSDVHRVPVDMTAGRIGNELESPYHGSYNLSSPLRLLPDGSAFILGSGLLFNTSDLTYRSSIGLQFVDVAFHGDRMYIIDTVGGTTQLRVLNSRFDILSAAYYPGTALRIFSHGGKIVLLTSVGSGGFEVRILNP